MESKPVQFSWENIGKIAIVCFAAGGIYMTIVTNNTKITNLASAVESKFTQSLDDQTKSNTKLSEAIVSLNMTMVRLEQSLKSKQEDIADIKVILDKHDVQIEANQDDIIRLKK